MRIDTNLKIETYVEAVQRIADGFFADDGSYAPHLGRIAAMGSFFDYCVQESKWDNIENPDANEMLLDREFIDAYSKAILEDNQVAMNFGNAYHDALAIVDNRNSSIVQLAALVNGFIEKYLTPDNIDKLFGNSERFKEITRSNPDSAFQDKVISMFEKNAR